MTVGAGSHTYDVAEGWGDRPGNWRWGWVVGMACDSQDRVFMYSRSEYPLIVYDRDGHILETWGDEVLPENSAHGIFIDKDDNVYCTAFTAHCVYKFNPQGELVMTIGAPGQMGTNDGDPFNRPTDLAIASTGDIFISDGYGNTRMHKYSPEGKRLLSWGERGDGPGQFDLVHCVRVDREDRVWVCDRANNRLQIFDLDGQYISECSGLLEPNTIYFDPQEDIIYIAELGHRFSIYTLDGNLITQWGDGVPSEEPGKFIGGPHGLWMDSHGDIYTGEVVLGERSRMHKYVRKG